MRYEYYLTANQVKMLPSYGKNWQKIFNYAKMMENGIEFPPVNIFFDDRKNCWNYNDGRNRVMAAKLTGLPLKVRSAKKIKSKN